MRVEFGMNGNLNWLSLLSGASQGATSPNKVLVNVDAGFSRGSGESSLSDAGAAFAHALWHASQAFTEALGDGNPGKAKGLGKQAQAFEEVWLHLSFLVEDDGSKTIDASTSAGTPPSTPSTPSSPGASPSQGASGDDTAGSAGAADPGSTTAGAPPAGASGSPGSAGAGSTGSSDSAGTEGAGASSTAGSGASAPAGAGSAPAGSSASGATGAPPQGSTPVASDPATADPDAKDATDTQTAGATAPTSSSAPTGGTDAGAGTTAPVTSSPPGSAPSTPTSPVSSVSGSSSKNNFLMGVNIAGGEFGQVGGAYGSNYIYPSRSEIDYYAGKGLEVIRVPFRWERLQTSLNGPLDATELARIDDVVNYAASKGLKVVLDAHNYGAGFGSLIGSGATTNAAFADFWGKMASHYKASDNVILGLMNEPNQQSATTWLDSANSAIAAIRDTGAKNEILVPGSYWDGAWTWTSSDNAKVIGGGIKDPANNFAFEVHQYMDTDGSGTHTDVVSDTAGVDRLKAVTEWAKATGNRLFLGEFGVANDSTSMKALDGMLSYMKDNSDVWQGGTYWAGGAWWGDYMYSAEPQGSTDKAQLLALQKYA
jgi:endoglucanase